MKEYAYLLVDADHTLLNYTADERIAFQKLFDELGVAYDDEFLTACTRLSEKAWAEAGLYDVHKKEVQRDYHQRYISHLPALFDEIFALKGYRGDSKKATKRTLKLLEEAGVYIDGAEAFLTTIFQKSGGRLCVVTNGLTAMQKGRLRDLKKYFTHVFVSEQLGAIKPMEKFYRKVCKRLGVAPQDCLMIGDSLSSDVAGAHAVGMDSLWINTRRLPPDPACQPTYQADTLWEAIKLFG